MQMLTRLISIMICFIIGLSVAIAQEVAESKNELISAKQLVVMIDGRFPTTDKLTEGAGIVVGRKGGLVYIATAGHVVQGLTEAAVDIKVQFQDRPGEEIDATLWPSNLDKGIDLAILVVPESRAPASITSLNEFSAARISQEVKAGEGAYLFGQPSGRVWSGNKSPEKVVSSTLTSIEVESKSVVPGMSGGATFDEGLRIFGLIVEADNGLARVVPLRLLKETLEQAGYPFDLTDGHAYGIGFLSHNDRIKMLRSLGVEFNEEGYLDAIQKSKAEALDIFHRETPFFTAETFYQWVEQNQKNFDLSQRNNIAKYIGKYDIPHISLVKSKIGQQVSFVRDFLKKSRISGLNISELCESFKKLKPILINSPTNECSDGKDMGLWLLGLYEIAENYGADGAELEDYGIYSYIPNWFIEGKTPSNIKRISFSNTETELDVPQCGYSLANTRFTVWENQYAIIPDFGKAILPRNGRYVGLNIGSDSRVCFSFYYNGVKKTQHVQCRGEVLLYRLCNSDVINWIGVRGHLLSDGEGVKRINNIRYLGNLTNQAWRASERGASIWPSEESNKAILFMSCRGNNIFVRSELSELLGALPNRVTLKFDFGGEVHTAEFVGQSDESGASESPYVAFFTRKLAIALSGAYSSVKIYVQGKGIGALSLKDSSWAINKGLADCLST
ncbi:S1 family peptidase [Cohaesibacter gelatinilyticus]|uniref:Trypsin-like peptidase domain-containing protein n=1 Tax=Cohaesibacter gelatinilyticus TaxID=372072 RepID=A0A285NER4_9HYPH|nr:serine protease [Cohaesibacter gelatinilyticus]SNZ07457.1 Trypsin-like peptidase domain-containing protein [Cohaesibacter gelatinilyticus]